MSRIHVAQAALQPETLAVVHPSKPVFSVPVRELVEFVLRSGDLGGAGLFVGSNRAVAGTQGHRQVQRSRPEGYQREVSLSHELETAEFTLRVQGRIDGLFETPAGVVLEEIKTVQNSWDRQANPLHWAQAKCYGFIYAQEHGLAHLLLQLSYLDLDSGELTEFQQHLSSADLAAFFHETVAVYLDWIHEQDHWRQQRDRSIESLDFPFPQYRPGQRESAVAVYRTLSRGGRLFLEAPTGIGKTMSVLFPALKALAGGKLEKLFYLTARTTARAAAEQALATLRAAGLRARTLTLIAKEKLCVQEGQPCDPQSCPFARGYYDRNKPAMREALRRETLTRPEIEAVSREFQVCPFELSLDLSVWVDAVICDYNYVFDPKVYLRRHFSEEARAYGFLIDEAHNLPDRAREMFSAELESREIRAVQRAIKLSLPRCAHALSRLNSALGKLGSSPEETAAANDLNSAVEAQPLLAAENVDLTAPRRSAPGCAPRETGTRGNLGRGTRIRRDLPEALLPLIDGAMKEAEAWLAKNEPADFRESLLELYFRLHSFRCTAELYDDHFVTLFDPESSQAWPSPRENAASAESDRPLSLTPRRFRTQVVRLFCLDPSALLSEALKRGAAAVFFSATLTPLDYYRTLLGGNPEDPVVQLNSPFPPENLALLVQDTIRTDFRARGGTLSEMVHALGALLRQRHGNYLVYFPSYQYLNSARERFQVLYPETPVLVQRPGMTDAERESFLAQFSIESGSAVGFAVMGGVFGEGIDLVGDRLIGVVVVGVGLPQLSLERDLIRDYFQEKNGAGYEYAYTFPGMNRVLQAAGRVIRSETDRGVVLLIDSRFGQMRYRRLFPPWWRPARIRNAAELVEAVSDFWLSAAG